ncbi:MAG: hypothetical protein HY055_02015 [Magnetospirillum sp.]|nr:hypothetical protein [Magnetospirillum sp.]
MRSFLQNLALMLASILLALIGLEAACWTFAPPPKPGLPVNLMEVGPDGVWRITPNFQGIMDNRVDYTDAAVTSDAQGRRVVPAAPAQAPRRLLVLGDSQTFGHGISDGESWPNRLQERLIRRGAAVQVLNYAIPGTNIDQYKARADTLIPMLGPSDTVLVGVSWNDLITPLPELKDGVPPPPATQSMQVIEGHLVSNSGEDRDAIAARVKFYKWSGIVIPPFQGVKSALDALSQSSALVGLAYPHAKALYYRLRAQTPVAQLIGDGVPEGNFIWLAHMRDRIESKGGRMVVALLVERQFFEDEAYRVYSVNGRDYAPQDYMTHLAAPLCQIYRMQCLNVFPLLHDHQAEGLVFRLDGHFNAKGAALLGPWLADQVFPPAGN